MKLIDRNIIHINNIEIEFKKKKVRNSINQKNI